MIGLAVRVHCSVRSLTHLTKKEEEGRDYQCLGARLSQPPTTDNLQGQRPVTAQYLRNRLQQPSFQPMLDIAFLFRPGPPFPHIPAYQDHGLLLYAGAQAA